MRTLTGKEMSAQARQELIQEQQDAHIKNIKQQLKSISTAGKQLVLAQERLTEEQSKLIELELKDITELYINN